jgi:hypothetical protein
MNNLRDVALVCGDAGVPTEIWLTRPDGGSAGRQRFGGSSEISADHHHVVGCHEASITDR